MEYFSRILKILKYHKQFVYHLRWSKLKLIQLEFKDDMLLFCKGEQRSVQLLFDYFQEFSKALSV